MIFASSQIWISENLSDIGESLLNAMFTELHGMNSTIYNIIVTNLI